LGSHAFRGNLISDFDGKVVIVTGATAGLGRHLCDAFAERRSTIVPVARNSDRLRLTCQELQKRPVQVHAIPTDVTQPQQVADMMDQVSRRFGRLDVLVNNVGQSSRGLASETEPEAFCRSLELNLISTVHCVRAGLALLESSHGHIVNIGSLASKFATPVLGAYPVGKFALAAYTQQLRLELRDRGIHVMLVCPGPLRRADAGRRYDSEGATLSEAARAPGGGARLALIDPQWLARRIVDGCQRRKPEIVVPVQARLLAALQQLSPRCGDWLLSRRLHK
jgi:short-subunit dehydrogenase